MTRGADRGNIERGMLGTHYIRARAEVTHAIARTVRWVVVVLLVATLGASSPARSEPTGDDDEHAAVRAYQAKDYPSFLAHMRALDARLPGLPRVMYNLAAAE